MDNGDKTRDRQLWIKFCWVFWLLELVVRPAAALLLPIDLAGDEAYYWEWGQHLDWGYFSKPPGIAWLMAFADWLGNGTTAGLRIVAAALGMGGAWFIVLTARRCFGTQVAVWCGLAWILTPANSALHLLLTIDAPLVFFWAMALWATREWIAAEGRSWKHTAFIAVALAGGILSKQMMLIYFLLVILAFITDGKWRGYLGRVQLWVGGVAGYLIGLAPPLWWNAQNNWITLQHTMHHFESAPPTLEKRISRFFELFGAELALVTPVLFFLIVISGIGVVKKWRSVNSDFRLLWWMSMPSIVIMFGLTWRQRVNPNWPAVFLVAGTIMGIAWFMRKKPEEESANQSTDNDAQVRSTRNWVLPGIKVAAGFTAMCYLILILTSYNIVSFPGIDPSARIRQWSNIAEDIRGTLDKHVADGTISSDFFYVTISHRFLTSELRFFLPGNPRVYRFSPEPDLLRSQHDLWPNPSTLTGQNAVIIVQGVPDLLPEEIKEYFEQFTLIDEITNPVRRKKWQRFTLFYGENLQFWPAKDFESARHQ